MDGINQHWEREYKDSLLAKWSQWEYRELFKNCFASPSKSDQDKGYNGFWLFCREFARCTPIPEQQKDIFIHQCMKWIGLFEIEVGKLELIRLESKSTINNTTNYPPISIHQTYNEPTINSSPNYPYNTNSYPSHHNSEPLIYNPPQEITTPTSAPTESNNLDSTIIEPEQGDIVEEIVTTIIKHIVLASETRAGKTTLLKAIAHRLLTKNPQTALYIIDGKAADWLGLQKHPGTVCYLEGEESQQIDQAEHQLGKVFNILQKRKKALKDARLQDQPPPKFHPVYCIICEWYAIYDKIKRQKRTEPIRGWVSEIIALGAELEVRVILDTQSVDVAEIGFSSSMRRCFHALALGYKGIGFDSISGALNNNYLFPNPNIREKLQLQLKRAIQICTNQRILLSTLGENTPKIVLVPDLSWVNQFSFVVPDTKTIPPDQPKSPPPNPNTNNQNNKTEYRPLFKAISLLKQYQVPDITIIQEVLNLGNNIAKGQKALEALIQLGEGEGW